MPANISPLAHVDPAALLGSDVTIGPFCLVGPGVRLGEGTRLDSHVVLTGNTETGCNNRFLPHCVIGADPQDKGYEESETRLLIGNDNMFREGVTINRGAEKDDGTTRIGNRNLLMANSHVAHNSHVHDDVILVNGVLLGGHVDVADKAIISGNSVVHHYSSIGTLVFVSGGCRVPHDIPPYMMAAGSDNPRLTSINKIGMERAGIDSDTMMLIRQAFRMHFRKRQTIERVQQHFEAELHGQLPPELTHWLSFITSQIQGHNLRARDPVGNSKPDELRATPEQTDNTDTLPKRKAA
ncbi:MAG: acyl-ACP--UDP-N-acetylglucosamine O-acyltransferase [Planctomycetaceae bacterium]